MNCLKIPVVLFLLLLTNFIFGQGLKISHLEGDFYVYTTWQQLDNGSLFPANGMYAVTSNGVIMFDTPWDTTQVQPLLDSMEQKHKKQVILCLATHYHNDRTGGLDILRRKGIKTYSSKLTWDLCKQKNEKKAEYYFNNDTSFVIGNYSFQTFYPGAGHTKDNIIVWFPNRKILYGGCIVKSTENTSLGNIADADVGEWESSIQKLIKKYPDAKYIIPGHFGWDDNTSLQHTLYLVKKEKDRTKK